MVLISECFEPAFPLLPDGLDCPSLYKSTVLGLGLDCDADLNQLDRRAPKGTFFYDLCPITCQLCDPECNYIFVLQEQLEKMFQFSCCF